MERRRRGSGPPLTRTALAASVGLAGLGTVLVAKRLTWTHTSGDYRGPNVTLDLYQDAAKYEHLPWTSLFATWLLSALIVVSALTAVLAFTRPRTRPLGVAVCTGAAVVTAYVGQRLPGDAGVVEGPSQHTFTGVGPGAWFGVVGFVLLAAAAAFAPPVLPVQASDGRRVEALALLAGGGWLVSTGLEYASRYDSRGRDWPYPMYLRDLVSYVAYGNRGQVPVAGHLHTIGWTLVAVTAGLSLLAIVFGWRPLRGLAALVGLAGAVSVVVILALAWHHGSSPTEPASHNVFFKTQLGFWAFLGGCVVLGIAGLVAPGRTRQGVPPRETFPS